MVVVPKWEKSSDMLLACMVLRVQEGYVLTVTLERREEWQLEY
jgi:hypothetical protein